MVPDMIPHVTTATILTRCAKGEDVLILSNILTLSVIRFQYQSLQFIFQLSFAMSFDKSKIQTPFVAESHLEEFCFSYE